MPWRCLPLCVNTAAKFGSQTQELNISLTAVGLMVSIYLPEDIIVISINAKSL